MKKRLILLLTLLLCGCSAQAGTTETAPPVNSGTLAVQFLENGTTVLEHGGNALTIGPDAFREDPVLPGVSLQILAEEADLFALRADFGETSLLYVRSENADAQKRLLREPIQATVLQVTGDVSGELLCAVSPTHLVLTEGTADVPEGVVLLQTEELGLLQAESDGSGFLFAWSMVTSSTAAVSTPAA